MQNKSGAPVAFVDFKVMLSFSELFEVNVHFSCVMGIMFASLASFLSCIMLLPVLGQGSGNICIADTAVILC